jgi:hypothetical protein
MFSRIKVLVKCFSQLVVLSIVIMKAQDIQPQPMPEPTTIYTCGENFQPSDLAFDKQNILYVVESSQDTTQPYIYYFQDSSCLSMGLRSDIDPTYITANPDGNICITDKEIKRRRTREVLSCWNGKKWNRQNILDDFIFSNDLAFSSHHMWLAHSRSFNYPSPGLESGGISYFKNGKLVAIWMRPTDMIARQPNFVVATTDKAIFTELNSRKESDFSISHRGGSIVEIDTEGASRILNDDFDTPTGITLIEGFLWVADYATGELYQLDINGNTKAIYQGLQGPMGITQAPNGDLCIAEMIGARVSCYSLASLGLD